MGHGSSLCAKYLERIVKQLKNHISQCKITKNVCLSSSSIHNIVTKFRESREISVCVGQGRRPLLNLRDLRALRWHCMRNHHATLLNTATCAQEVFRKPFLLNTVWPCIKKWHLNLCYTRRKLYISSMWRCRRVLWAWAHLTWSRRQWECVLWSDESMFQLVFGKKWTLSSQSQRRKGPTRLSPATSAKANICPGIEVQRCKRYG